MEEIRKELKRKENNTDFVYEHIALVNTNNRIKAHYGKKYGLTLESDGVTYTSVVLTVKALPIEKDDDIV